jgi:hypothetical protein
MADRKAVRKFTRELVMASFENRSPSALPDDMTMKECVEICQKGQMQYLTFKSLLKIAENCPEFDKIRNSLNQSTFRTFLQVMAAREITTAFEKEGIRHQLLKGAILKNIYPSPEMRDMSDVDLVVYDDTLDRAAKVMEQMGYQNHGLIKHHMIFSKGPNLMIEVHWCLFDQNAGKSQHMYFKDLRAKLVEGKQYTYEFGLEDFYVYMIAHMAKHFFETGCGIRNLVDIYVYLNKYNDSMDREYLEKELQKCGIYDFEKNMRELAYIWLEDRECPEFFENLFEYMVDSGIYGKTENGVWSQLAKETKDSCSNIKLHYYFPSIKFMEEKYPWLKKAPFLLPVAWIMRGVSGVSQKQSRDHRKQLEQVDKKEVAKILDMYHRLNFNFRK